MKRNLLSSYISGIQNKTEGQEYIQLAGYFIPELITAVILYSIPLLIDARFIAHLHSTTAYATLGVTNTFLHFIMKIAEGLSVGTIILSGQFNGSKEYEHVGKTLVASFWVTVGIGGVIAGFLYILAGPIYQLYGVAPEMVKMGIPFLRIRAIGIFFTFVYFALIGFLRGIKNTRVTMNIFIIGCLIFLCFDYVLIFGKYGFPELGLYGSALSTVIQYAFMAGAALFYIIWNQLFKTYRIRFFSSFASLSNMKELFMLSWPVVIDKGALAGAYMWLGYCLAPMGTNTLASFSAIKDLERFALLPAIAFAQVVTFLVSNDCGKKDWTGIKVTIKKIVFLATMMVFIVLVICSLWPKEIIQIFDMKGDFAEFSAQAFPIISVLVFFDVLQLILAGALRGVSNVKTVMWTRLYVCCGFFAPLAYSLSLLNFTHQIVKFVLIYSSFYVGNALMSVIYVRRFRGHQWKEQAGRNIK
ncbi:MATE family efflux transporter [Candidatus Babeliales bacterium]|nr:MATE family efflux transporter [Candidatus Babeliales bacterium]